MKRFPVLNAALALCLLAFPLGAQTKPGQSAASPVPAAAVAPGEVGMGWPRHFTAEGAEITVFQPQLDSWQHNQLAGRAAVSVTTQASPLPLYGVVWFTARTEVNKELGQVTLEDLQITKGDFPKEPGDQHDYVSLVRQHLPEVSHTIALARLEANLAVTQAGQKVDRLPLKNDPPRIFFSTTPAVLVLVDGPPALREVQGTPLMRVINTRVLMLMDKENGPYYLAIMDQWLEAPKMEGPWTLSQKPPAGLEQAKKTAAATGQVDLLNNPDDPRLADTSHIPVIYVSTGPAELLQTQGQPGFAPIDGTQLLVVKNTSDHLFLNLADQAYYVLISGRWFKSKNLAGGPWEFVPGDKLPADFAKIPENHPSGDVLVSVPGTPQSQEAVIANSIPQTAAIDKKKASMTARYDGDPKFKPIEGTRLQYAVNSPDPVIKAKDAYYSVNNGVWFRSGSPNGPWSVADSVPPEIYTIPPSSPMHYITYVRVYQATPEVVYVGYTPGYLGTAVSPDGTVVYGTGYVYPPWVGSVYYPPPPTYGYGASFGLGALTGLALGFTAAALLSPWGPFWGGGWGGNVNINNTNIYNHWGPHPPPPPPPHPPGPKPGPPGPKPGPKPGPGPKAGTKAGPPGAQKGAKAGPPAGVKSGPHTHGDVYAGKNGGVYRREGGQWQEHQGNQGWKPASPETARARGLGQEERARSLGEQRMQRPAPRPSAPRGGFAPHGGGGHGGGRHR
jgi:hypothetical protein